MKLVEFTKEKEIVAMTVWNGALIIAAKDGVYHVDADGEVEKVALVFKENAK